MTFSGLLIVAVGVGLMMLAVVPELSRRLRGGFFYGWWLVVISGFVMVIGSVPLFHAMSLWAVALEHQFGWSRTQLGLALTLTRVEGGIMGPVEGYLSDKVGTRRMVMIGMIIMGIGFLIFGRVNSLWMFYSAYLVMSMGMGLGSWVPMMTLLNHWFARQRAMAISWANVGSRLGALLLVPAIAWAIEPGHGPLGWSVTASLFGIFAIAIAFPISRLIRNRPQDYGQGPDGDPVLAETSPSPTEAVQENSGGSATEFTASQALRTPAFWLISFGHGFTSMIIIAIMAHLGLLLQDHGYPLQTTGWIVAVYTAVAMVFQVVGGYVGDRMPKRMALFIFTTIQAGAVVILTMASDLSTFYLFAVLFGVGFGGRNPLTIAVRGEYFGRASFGKILGLSTVPMNVLLLIASPLAGYMRDVQGTYTNAFLILAALNFIGGVCFLFAKRPVLPGAQDRPSGPVRAVTAGGNNAR
ncbi:MAG: MFS transporter [Planctomyces sp.]|nr:MFS transporter [Planctomyces sp.]